MKTFVLNAFNFGTVDLFNPQQVDDFVKNVDVDLLMNTLNTINRFAGQRGVYTVDIHSEFCAKLYLIVLSTACHNLNLDTVSVLATASARSIFYECLFHDIEEAVTGDVITPVKVHLSDEAKDAINNLRNTFYRRLGVKETSLCHKIDTLVYSFEDLAVGRELDYYSSQSDKLEVLFQKITSAIEECELYIKHWAQFSEFKPGNESSKFIISFESSITEEEQRNISRQMTEFIQIITGDYLYVFIEFPYESFSFFELLRGIYGSCYLLLVNYGADIFTCRVQELQQDPSLAEVLLPTDNSPFLE